MGLYTKIDQLGLVPAKVVVTIEMINDAGGVVIRETSGRRNLPTGKFWVEFGPEKAKEAIELPFVVSYSLSGADGYDATFTTNNNCSDFGVGMFIERKLGIHKVVVKLPFRVFGDLPSPSYVWGYDPAGNGFAVCPQVDQLDVNDARAAVLDYIQQVVAMGVLTLEEILAALQAAKA